MLVVVEGWIDGEMMMIVIMMVIKVMMIMLLMDGDSYDDVDCDDV